MPLLSTLQGGSHLFSRRVEEVVKEALADPNSTKRTIFLISTDGNPDERGPAMQETTKQAVLALHDRGLNPSRYIAVSCIILIDDFHTMACYLKLENNKSWGVGQEYDVANAVFPFQIKSLGSCDNKTTVNIALGGAVSEEIDQALEEVVGVAAKSLMDLMTAYAKRGFADDWTTAKLNGPSAVIRSLVEGGRVAMSSDSLMQGMWGDNWLCLSL